VASQAQCNGTSTTTPCCRADFNKVGGITVQDVYDFLSAWFAGDPAADYVNNGAGTPTQPSIPAFINAWFISGC
jgi:hypothetical protein